MPTQPIPRDWLLMDKDERNRRSKEICKAKVNRGLSARKLAEKYFFNISGTGYTTHLWRNKILAPRLLFPTPRRRPAKIKAVKRGRHR